MSRHRGVARPRYGRITALTSSLVVSAVAALAGLGILGTGSATAGAVTDTAYHHAAAGSPAGTASSGPGPSASPNATATDSATGSTGSTATTQGSALTEDTVHAAPPDPKALPADSGSGRRIVFDQSAQRVWLVGAKADTVERTYLVSGSVTHNLHPGTYAVYSRSRWAVGVDDSGVMQYFVRFTQGPTGAAIGFHSIPTKHGVPQQTRAQLGTPQSHGCIRQDLPDAIALWDFAPQGTKVVVVA